MTALEQFLQTDTATAAITESEHLREISRRDLAEALQSATEDLTAAAAAADLEIDAAAAEVDSAQVALDEAQGRLRDARLAKLARCEQPRNRVSALERQLRSIDPPQVIGEFLEWIAAELEALRIRKPDIRYESRADYFGHPQTVPVESDSASLHRRNLALLAARDAVSDLLIQPPDDWATEVDRLRQTIPAVQLEAIR